MAESNVLVQMLYMPMMFLSGATIPASLLPRWTQTVAQFMPAAYLVSGMQGIVTQHESLAANWKSAGALADHARASRSSSRSQSVPVGEGREAEGVREAVGGRRDAAVPRARRLPVPHERADRQEPDAVAPAAARRHVPDPRTRRSSSATAASSRPGSVLVRKGRIEAVYDGAGPDAASAEGGRRRSVRQDDDARVDRRPRAHGRARAACTPTRRTT